jgi:serine/alanine adding enzyme
MASPKANLYHLSGWQNIINKTYGHKTCYLMATHEPESSKLSVKNYELSLPRETQSMFNWGANNYELNPDTLVGILPLVHLKHFLFGNSLISLPFFDLGGIVANDEETEKALLLQAIKLAGDLKVNKIELRHQEPLAWLTGSYKLSAMSYELSAITYQLSPMSYKLSAMSYATKSHKVRMLLHLPDSSDALMKSFKAKLRSQIKKPIKEGLFSKVGGLELLDDFYTVFSINMRDLGSPVHAKALIQNVCKEFPEKSNIVMVYKDDQPIAGSIIIGFKDTLENPWASSLKKYSSLSPNMLLYWTMLEYACDNDFKYFDFGRSSPDEGTYKFKEQWGAHPIPLHWHYIALHDQPASEETLEEEKFEKAIQYWQRLPVALTKILGPMIRKHIGL